MRKKVVPYGYCQRTGDKVPLTRLVRDGYRKNLLVIPEARDAVHPQEEPVRLTEHLAPKNPAPLQDVDSSTTPSGTVASTLFAGERYFGGGT